MLDAGTLPDQFGFHIFPCAAPREYRSFNVYFLCPRGVEEFDAPSVDIIQKYLLEQLERMIPGLPSAVDFQHLVSPAQFRKEHHLSPQPIRAVLPLGISKPDIYDPVQDIHYIGNTVGPPGEHAGAAILSGLQAAHAISTAS
jgi:hypothetical protein